MRQKKGMPRVDASQNRAGHVSGVTAILVASLMWGTTGTAASFIPGIPPATIGAAAMGIGGLILGLTSVRGVRRVLATPGAWPLVFVGALALATYTLVFYVGMAWAGVAVGNVLALGSAPIFAGLIEWIVDRRRVSGRWVLATAVAVIGGILLVVGRDHNADWREMDPRLAAPGIAVALLAGLSYAVYTIVAARLITPPVVALPLIATPPTPTSADSPTPSSSASPTPSSSASCDISPAASAVSASPPSPASSSLASHEPRAVISSIQVVAAVPLLIVLGFTASPIIAQPLSWIILLYLAIFPTAIGHSLLAFSLGRMSASTSTVFSLFEPVVAVVLAAVIVGEAITPIGWFGLAVVLVGLALLSTPSRPRA